MTLPYFNITIKTTFISRWLKVLECRQGGIITKECSPPFHFEAQALNTKSRQVGNRLFVYIRKDYAQYCIYCEGLIPYIWGARGAVSILWMALWKVFLIQLTTIKNHQILLLGYVGMKV